jgi:hypothetical protein
MMKILLIIFFFSGTCFFLSWDCVQTSEGVVADGQTHKPLDSVLITTVDPAKQKTYTRASYTDSRGAYRFFHITGGLFGCPELVLYFNKPGYRQVQWHDAAGVRADTVFMERKP